MATNEKGDDENHNEIDKEVDLDDTLKDRDNKVKYHKNVLFVLLLAVIGLTVFGVSFYMGKKLFFAYRTTVNDSLQKNVTQNSKELPYVAVIPNAEKPVAGEEKNGVNESAPEKKVATPAAEGEKPVAATKPEVTTQDIIPAPIVSKVKPEIETPKPVAAAKPDVTAQDVIPAAIVPTVKPTVEAPKPVAKQKATAKAPEKLKKYKVIAGSFAEKANADSLISQLKAENYKPIIIQAETSKGQFFRVVVGSYGSLSETKPKLAELKKLGFQPFVITK